jgi:hypothetical protein
MGGISTVLDALWHSLFNVTDFWHSPLSVTDFWHLPLYVTDVWHLIFYPDCRILLSPLS